MAQAKSVLQRDAITPIVLRIVEAHPDAPARTLARRIVEETHGALTLEQARAAVETSKADVIALALVVFAGWRSGRLLVSAYFFGILMALELYAKASGFSVVPSQFWAAMPYLMTVVALTFISARGNAGSNAPACLGKPFLPSN